MPPGYREVVAQVIDDFMAEGEHFRTTQVAGHDDAVGRWLQMYRNNLRYW